MYIKFLSDGSTYELKSNVYNIGADKIKIDDRDVPVKSGGFILINNGMEIDFSKYKIIYEQTDSFVIYSSDTSIYYTYYLYDKDTKYVTSQITTTASTIEDGILKTSGQGKDFEFPETESLYDEDDFNKYKVNNGAIVLTTSEDKAPYMKEKTQKEFEEALSAKLDEISWACKAAIVDGVDFNNSHFSYGVEDQANISNCATLALQTQLAIPYHADGEDCRLFTVEEIVGLYVAEETNVTHHTTYHNQLKRYVNTLTTKAEIEQVQYGVTELTGKYKETYDMIMAQSAEIIKKFIGE